MCLDRLNLSQSRIKKLQDYLTTGFLALCIPGIFLFELWIIIPDIIDENSYHYKIHFCIGVFLLVNIAGNFLMVIKTNTSIKGTMLIQPEREFTSDLQHWHLCVSCQIMVPPRTWHCDICKTCILKRDHHCSFTGKCVGHKNHRYFILLIIYLFIATVYSNIFTNYYFWILHRTEFLSFLSIFRIFFPLAMLTVNFTTSQSYLLVYVILMIGMIFTGTLTVYHLRLITRGAVAYEKNESKYDIGVKDNLKIVFGKRWYIAWLFPLIKSPLTHDGVHWNYLLQDSGKGK